MKPTRLDELSDGIFAIVMTILVFDIRVPELSTHVSNMELWSALQNIIPSFLSYILAFAMLFTYWRAHHFFVSVYAKNINVRLTNINALFFLFVGLVPFSASLLGRHSENRLAIIIFGANAILIGLCLYWMRNYIINSEYLKNGEITKHDLYGSTVRTLVPVFFSILAIILCFYNKQLSLTLLTCAVLFNFSQTSTILFHKILRRFMRIFKMKEWEYFEEE
ncbi:TMEM175 family protein [Candidatus Nomurabacteria bacterium]|nr:TMEM175 family protein [Candidatus Nomurabacteria bacterium]